MNEIKISVDDENLETLLTILNNLKTGLITKIEINAKASKVRTPPYQPKTKQIMRDDDFGTNDSSGKYINPATYKQRLKKSKN